MSAAAPGRPAASTGGPRAEITLRKNQPLMLDEPGVMWLVKEGAMEVLSTRVEDGAPVGHRRALFQVPRMRSLFGFAPDADTGNLATMAVATTRTVLARHELRRVSANLTAGPVGQGLIDAWVREVCDVMAESYDRPGNAVQMPRGIRVLEYGQSDVVLPFSRDCAWLKLSEGSLRLFGREEMTLTAEHGFILVSPEVWFEVGSEDVKFNVFPMPGPDIGSSLQDGLDTLQGFLNIHLKRISDEEERAELERRAASAALQDLESEGAMTELSTVLDPQERFARRESHLLTAVSAVGQVMGIRINPPAASEDTRRLRDPIEAIARASRIRYRMVLLGADWWTNDSGPLVAYLGEEERRPVALLPSSDGYQIVDPEKREREPLTEELRERLSSDAHMLYRSLPDRVSGVMGLLKFTVRGRVHDMVFIVAMGIIATLLGMVVPRVTGILVDTAIPNADRGLVYELALLLTAAGIGGALFTYAQVLGTVRTSIRAEVDSQSSMWDRLLKFRPDFFRRYSSGDLQTRVNAVSEISRELSGATLRPLISGVLALLNFLLLWYYSWELAKIAIWVGLLVLLVTLVVTHFVRRLSIQLHELDGRFNGLMIQMIGGVGKLRVAGSEQRAFNHWVKQYTEQVHVTLRIQRLKDIIKVFNLMVPPLATALLFWKAMDLTIGLPEGDADRITIGDFIAFNTAFVLYIAGWNDVSNTVVQVLDALAKGQRIEPILKGRPEVSLDASDPGRLSGHLRLENVCFRYAEDGPQILDNVSFEALPGEYIAFVGPSGSGKSTILRMLLGFERPQSGRVLYDGQDLGGLDVLAVRRQVGTVLQDGRLNAGNILENIANNANISHAEAWDAAADAGLTEDIEEMAMGLHTMVSEGGTNLSGGQRQRLLIARALAIRPRMVFFDEATSALDNRTQSVVSEALDRRGVTRVVIAHRLSTIRQANRIYVLDQGRIVQSGTFKALSEQEGLFNDLMARQMT